mmetsp:Transcript_6733/g.7718  ORF Transcript_6733/g.7718 Transcript_6733/m.7718 type:complete len:278 (-) Transcript_6733:107-940(-)
MCPEGGFSEKNICNKFKGAGAGELSTIRDHDLSYFTYDDDESEAEAESESESLHSNYNDDESVSNEVCSFKKLGFNDSGISYSVLQDVEKSEKTNAIRYLDTLCTRCSPLLGGKILFSKLKHMCEAWFTLLTHVSDFAEFFVDNQLKKKRPVYSGYLSMKALKTATPPPSATDIEVRKAQNSLYNTYKTTRAIVCKIALLGAEPEPCAVDARINVATGIERVITLFGSKWDKADVWETAQFIRKNRETIADYRQRKNRFKEFGLSCLKRKDMWDGID